MSRLLRIVLAVAAVAVAGLLVLVIAVSLLVRPKDYAPVLARAVQAATGRALTIRGDLGLSLFPCCGITVGGATLGNPPGFPAGPFVELAGARLTFRLWPLLVRRDVEVGRVVLDGLQVSLLELADGRRNWDFGTGETGTAATPGGMAAGELRVAALTIRNGAVSYRNERSKAGYAVRKLALRTGELAPGRSFDVDAAGEVTDAGTGLTLDLHLASGGIVSGDGAALTLSKPQLTVAARGSSLPDKGLTATLGAGEAQYARAGGAFRLQRFEGEVAAPGLSSPAADVAASFVIPALSGTAGEQLAMTAPAATVTFSLKGRGIPGHAIDGRFTLGGLTLDGDFAARVARIDGRVDGLGGSLAFTGSGGRNRDGNAMTGELRLAPVSPRSVLAVLGRPPPQTRDPEALTRLTGAAAIALDADGVNLHDLDVHLDRSRLTGRLQIPAGDSHATQFDVKVDTLDVDRYRPPPGKDKPADRGAQPGEGAAVELPRDLLRDLRLDGQLAVGALTLAGAHLGNVAATIRAGGNSLRVDPLSATLYGGTLRGRLALDSAGATPRLTLRQQLDGVKLGELLRDAYHTDKLEGTLSATLDAAGQGRTDATLIRSLAGTAAANLTGGAWHGVDFWYEVRRARALLRREDGPAKPAQPVTPIQRLEFSGTIADGVWRSERLVAEIPFVQLGGAGALNLPERSVDFALHADVTQPPVFADGTNLRDLNGFSIPLTVQGPMTDPRVRVDLASLAKSALAQKLKQKLIGKLGLEAPDAKPAPGQQPAPESPKDELRRKLRDLLRR